MNGYNVFANENRKIVAPAVELARKLHLPVIFLNVQTTGLNEKKDRILQIGACRCFISETGELKYDGKFNQYCACDKEIPRTVTEINGITNELLKDADDIVTVMTKFKSFCGENPIFVAWDARFTMKFLYTCSIYTGVLIEPQCVIDEQNMMRDILSLKLLSFKFISILDYYKIDYQGKIRDAVFTTTTMGKLWKEHYPEFAAMVKNGDFPCGTEEPEILDVFYDHHQNLIKVYLKHHGFVEMEINGIWIDQTRVFDIISIDLLEKKLIEILHAESRIDAWKKAKAEFARECINPDGRYEGFRLVDGKLIPGRINQACEFYTADGQMVKLDKKEYRKTWFFECTFFEIK